MSSMRKKEEISPWTIYDHPDKSNKPVNPSNQNSDPDKNHPYIPQHNKKIYIQPSQIHSEQSQLKKLIDKMTLIQVIRDHVRLNYSHHEAFQLPEPRKHRSQSMASCDNKASLEQHVVKKGSNISKKRKPKSTQFRSQQLYLLGNPQNLQQISSIFPATTPNKGLTDPSNRNVPYFPKPYKGTNNIALPNLAASKHQFDDETIHTTLQTAKHSNERKLKPSKPTSFKALKRPKLSSLVFDYMS